MEDDGFVLVKKKKKPGHHKSKISEVTHESLNSTIPTEDAISDEELLQIQRKISNYKQELLGSHVWDQIKVLLDKDGDYSAIVCYGLGSMTTGYCTQSSRYQLALLLAIIDYVCLPCRIYDPVFTGPDLALLDHFHVETLKTNDNGKNRISEKTLFFMPRCPFELFNNLLWANWRCLQHLVLLGNDLSMLEDQMTKKEFVERLRFIHRALPLCTRHPINVGNSPLDTILNNSVLLTFNQPDTNVFSSMELEDLEPLISNS